MTEKRLSSYQIQLKNKLNDMNTEYLIDYVVEELVPNFQDRIKKESAAKRKRDEEYNHLLTDPTAYFTQICTLEGPHAKKYAKYKTEHTPQKRPRREVESRDQLPAAMKKLSAEIDKAFSAGVRVNILSYEVAAFQAKEDAEQKEKLAAIDKEMAEALAKIEELKKRKDAVTQKKDVSSQEPAQHMDGLSQDPASQPMEDESSQKNDVLFGLEVSDTED